MACLLAAAHEAHGALLRRHPRLRWVQRWGLSVASLVNGLVVLLLFRRGIERFPWIAGFLLLVWLGVVVFAQARQALEARGYRLARVALDYTVQSLLHATLIGLLPIYYASTTLDSANAAALGLLAGAALLTSVDPWYHGAIAGRPWALVALFSLALIAALNVALPLVGVRSTWALVASGAAGMLALVPAIRRAAGTTWRRGCLLAALAGLLAGSLLWSVRPAIPPVPLHLGRATFARAVDQLEPVQPVSRLSAAELQAWPGLACFTAIWAPAGLREPVTHLWSKDGVPVAAVRLAPIRGGRPGGYRTHSRRTALGPDPAGRWTVEVLTAHGQLIGRVRLTVTR
jgi:hypothetical protein